MHKINTVHKEKVSRLKCLLHINSTSSVGYWREVVFVFTFFGLVACLLIFAYRTFAYADLLIQFPTGFLDG